MKYILFTPFCGYKLSTMCASKKEEHENILNTKYNFFQTWTFAHLQ